MHITKVVIEGFESFKEKTIFEFQPGLNVVVGHDEAGKRNLLYAIQFVLAGNQFQQASHMDLVKLLHTSAGLRRVKSAYVEIVIDNKDRKICEEDCDEITLRRIITSSAKDVYKVNGKSISKDKVMTLQSTKLSKVNPYYITSPQKIREMCTSSTEKLRAVFCDIAGSLKALQSEKESIRERDSLVPSEERKKKLKKEIEADRIRRQELWSEIRVIENGLKKIGSDFEKIKLTFGKVTSKRVLQGLENVWNVVNVMKEEEDFKDLAREYRGLVIEQFECPTEYMIAADAIAKNRLFYHVGDTDRVGIEIRKRMTEKNMPGIAVFMYNATHGMGIFQVTHDYFVKDTTKMIMTIVSHTRPGMHFVTMWLFNDKLALCPTSRIAREVSEKKELTCVTLDGFVIHTPDDVPDGSSFPNLTRFKLFSDFKKAYENEKIQKNLLKERKQQVKDIETRIKRNEMEYRQIKTSTFQTERKAVQGSLKLLEAEITSLRNGIENALEVDPDSSLQELKDIMKELVLLKVNEKNLSILAEKLLKVICLNKKVIEIGLIVDSIKKQSEPAYQNDIQLHRERVLIQRPNMTNINQQLSQLKAEIDDTILLVDRAPLHLLDRDDGFSPRSQFIVTTLSPELFDYVDTNIIGLRFDAATQSSQVFKMTQKDARQFLDPPVEN